MRRGRLRTKAVGRRPFRVFAPTLISTVLLVAGQSALRADEFRAPAISVVHVEWRAALDQLRAEISTVPSAFTFSSQRRVPASDPRSTLALMQLNAVTSKIFKGIDQSPIPVLLPFDMAAFLDAQANGASADHRLRATRPISGRLTCLPPARPATTRFFRSNLAPAPACRNEPSPSLSRSRSPARS